MAATGVALRAAVVPTWPARSALIALSRHELTYEIDEARLTTLLERLRP
jgi:hypothetical protein